MRSLAVLVLFLLAGCAPPPEPAAEIPPAEARANVVALLPGHRLVRVERVMASNLGGRGESFRLASGQVFVINTFRGSKLADAAVAAHGEREQIESWARGTLNQQGPVLEARRLEHDSARGHGWLLTFAQANPAIHCAAGRAVLGLRSGSDDTGPTYDTAIALFLCYRAGPVPPEIPEMVRRLAIRDG